MTDDGLVGERGNFCYRHPSRQSYILCQRCGRTVCPSCSTQAAVGVHCPECVKEARSRAPRQRPATVRAARAWRAGSNVPVVTYSLIAICVVVYLAQLVFGDRLTYQLVFYAPLIGVQPWTLLTSLFAHASPIHILANMFSLFMLGPTLELALGRVRYLALYLLSGFGGSVAVIILVGANSSVLGASGAIFGLMAALVVMIRRIGGNTTQLLVVVAINLSIGFFVSTISWEAHVGGLISGALVALVYTRMQGPRNRNRQLAYMAGLTVALLIVSIVTTLLRG